MMSLNDILPFDLAMCKRLMAKSYEGEFRIKGYNPSTQLLVAVVVVGFRAVINAALPLTLATLPLSRADANKGGMHGIVILCIIRFAGSKAALGGLQRALSSRITHSMHQRFRAFCYEHVMSLSADYHFSKPVGETMTAVSWAGSLVNSWVDFVLSAIPLLIESATAFVAMCIMLPSTAASMLLATIALLLLLDSSWRQSSIENRQAANTCRRKQELHILNTLLCWSTVSECNNIMLEQRRHASMSQAYMRKMQHVDDDELQQEAIHEVVVMIGLAVTCMLLSSKDSQQEFGLMQLVPLSLHWTRVTNAVRSVGLSYAKFRNETWNTSLLRTVMATQPSIDPVLEGPLFTFRGGSIVFDAVNFGYNKDRLVLDSLSFSVEAGERIALIGRSGSGKSTIFRLITRHFDPNNGTVLVDGQDLRTVCLDSYRRNIGIVSQNAVLTSGTIRQNIAYPSLTATDSQVEMACKAAQIHDTIMRLPEEYDQEVGSSKLSAGELQRLVLARLLVQDPKIILLDEATSNLDGITEQKTWDMLRSFCKGKTTIVITHRLSSIRDADRIIVIGRGMKVEEGTHEELSGRKTSVYIKLLEAQEAASI